MADTLTQPATDDTSSTDPNLALQQQRQLDIPAPPPIDPSSTTSTTSTTSAAPTAPATTDATSSPPPPPPPPAPSSTSSTSFMDSIASDGSKEMQNFFGGLSTGSLPAGVTFDAATGSLKDASGGDVAFAPDGSMIVNGKQIAGPNSTYSGQIGAINKAANIEMIPGQGDVYTGPAGPAAPGGAASTASAAASPSLSSRASLSPTGGAPSGAAGVAGATPSGGQLAPPGTPAAGATPGAGGPYTAADAAIGSSVLPNTDPRTANLQNLLDSSASSLAGVDRNKMALDQFDQFQKATDPAYQLGLRRATQAAAGAGRIGSGMLRTSYGDLANQRDQQLDLAKKGYMTDALNGSIKDQFDKVNALSGLEGNAYGEGANNRNELRNERGYQGSLEEQAFQRALTQYQLTQQAKQQEFTNGVTLTDLGDKGNPADYYAEMAKQLNVDPRVIMALADKMGQGSTTSPTPTAPTIPTPPPYNPSVPSPQFPND